MPMRMRLMTYLAFAIDKCADYWSTICTWHNSRELIRNTFGRQAIPMTWDFAECNPFSRFDRKLDGDGGLDRRRLIEHDTRCYYLRRRDALQRDARALRSRVSRKRQCYRPIPPYYDNISYADLSDFFYVWLRQESVRRVAGRVLDPTNAEGRGVNREPIPNWIEGRKQRGTSS